MIGVGLSIVQLAVRQLLGFNPASLFAAGEQGVWYEPSLTNGTLFQDSAGTTPVTAVEQPVGLMLDKSGNGNHATQTTTTSRPVLSARVNLLTATETLATQTVTTQATTQTLRFEGAGTVTLSGTATGTYSAGSHSVTTTAGNLTLTVSGTVTKADLRAANDALNQPAYQRVNTATDYDTTGFKPYLRFDGVDDFLVTNSINFTGTDKMTVFAGVRKLSDAARGIIVELSAIATDLRKFVIDAPLDTTKKYRVVMAGDGVTNPEYAYTSVNFSAPDTSVLSAIFDRKLLDSSVLLRLDGGLSGVFSSPFAFTDNFGNYPLFIGRRGGTTAPFNGRLYSLIIRGAQSTTDQITQTETWVNGKTKAYA